MVDQLKLLTLKIIIIDQHHMPAIYITVKARSKSFARGGNPYYASVEATEIFLSAFVVATNTVTIIIMRHV